MIRSSNIMRRNKALLTVVRNLVVEVDFEQIQEPQPPFQVVASSRPLNSGETKFLPEGQRADYFRVINCSDALLSADDKQGVVGDIIQAHLGFDWRVIKPQSWGNGLRHNAYTIQKIGVAT